MNKDDVGKRYVEIINHRLGTNFSSIQDMLNNPNHVHEPIFIAFNWALTIEGSKYWNDRSDEQLSYYYLFNLIRKLTIHDQDTYTL